MIPTVEERENRPCFNCVFWDHYHCNGPGEYTPELRDCRILHSNELHHCKYNLQYDELVELFESGVIQ